MQACDWPWPWGGSLIILEEDLDSNPGQRDSSVWASSLQAWTAPHPGLRRPCSESSHLIQVGRGTEAWLPAQSARLRRMRGEGDTAQPSCPGAGSPDSTCQARALWKLFGSLVQSVDPGPVLAGHFFLGTRHSHAVPPPLLRKVSVLPPPRDTHSTTDSPSSSEGVISSSDWSLSRSQGSRVELSATSSTGAMLGLRLPEPFSVGSASLLPPPPPPLCAGRHSVFWRSMATVPGTEWLDLAGSPSQDCPGGGGSLPVLTVMSPQEGRDGPAGPMCKLRPKERGLAQG